MGAVLLWMLAGLAGWCAEYWVIGRRNPRWDGLRSAMRAQPQRTYVLLLMICFAFGPLPAALDFFAAGLGYAAITASRLINWRRVRLANRHPDKYMRLMWAGGPVEWRCRDCGASATVGADSFAGRVPYCFPCLGARDLWPDRRLGDGTVAQMLELEARVRAAGLLL